MAATGDHEMTTETIGPEYTGHMADALRRMQRATDLVERLARCTTPEQEFESLRDENGIVHDDGVEYDSVDELVADFGDDRIMEEYATFMHFVREAQDIVE